MKSDNSASHPDDQSVTTSVGVSSSTSQSFFDPTLPFEARIGLVIGQLTLEEKIDCLSTKVGVPRLGIPFNDNAEGIHGLVMTGFLAGGNVEIPTTTFPQPISMAQSWDTELLKQVGTVIGAEARFIAESPVYGQRKLLVMAPNADLGRDPRWGRTDECYGEDAYLNGTLTVGFVRGLQGDDPSRWQTAALLKHFLANSCEDGRLDTSSDFDERLFQEYYAVPFRMGIVEGGASSFMAAYNAYNGIPCTVHPMLREIAIEKWGLDGIICTDFLGMSNLVNKHHTHSDKAHAAAASLKAGISQFLEFPDYREAVREALDQKLLTEAEIDQALVRNLRIMGKLGLLDRPETARDKSAGSGQPPWLSEKHQAVVRRVTLESIVLLKNEDELLPLNKNSGLKIAVVGPLADRVMSDLYAPLPPYLVTPLEGIKNKAGSSVTILHQAGNISDAAQKFLDYDPARDIPAAVELARSADVAVVCVGNTPWCGGWSMGHATPGLPGEGMEALDRQSLTLEQEELIKQIFAVNPKTIVVLISSFPYAINWTQQSVPAILHLGHGSQEAGTALADVLFGDYNPGGRLVETWPVSLEQLPPMPDYNIRHGRTYMYFEGEPLYPFGYGLSYTRFGYSNLRLDAVVIGSANHRVSVSVDITNTGERAGEEVVQLYVRHLESMVERPSQELKGFQRVQLKAGETRTVVLSLSANDLSYWNVDQQDFTLEPGKVELRVGSSSADIKFKVFLKVVP